MKTTPKWIVRFLAASLVSLTFCLAVPDAPAQTRTLRIATYNIEDDIDGATVPLPGLIAPPNNTNDVQAGGVVEGVGEEILGDGRAQPLDILALEETTSNPLTVVPIVNGLNSFYAYNHAAAIYTNSTYQATESGGDVADGNGPNAIIYNAATLQLLASAPVDPPGGATALGSGSGEYREVMRYEFAPAGVVAAATNEFYIYVSHYKSGTTAADLTDRAGEAQIIRNDEASHLPANASVLYVGDYNVTASTEAGLQTILSNAAPNGIIQGQGIDPLNPGNTNINWGASTTSQSILAMETESATDLRYRDDLQIMTTNIYYGSGTGLKLVPGTCHAFGNNGTTPYYGSVNSGSDTALTNLMADAAISAAQLLLDLTNASDHLPVVADYTIPVPAPVITATAINGGNLAFNIGSTVTNGVYRVLASPSLFPDYADWAALATNIASGGSLVITLTNVINPGIPAQFYILNQM